jgi:ubiquinone/menaquinone biosynthesis C-methylase UbiE
MSKHDYVLGTHEAEIARLGIQHRVWRPHMLGAWMRAGMTSASRVIDIGAGPAFATLDAAEIVGPRGEVVAIERSPNFLAFAAQELARRNVKNVRLVESDLMGDDVVPAGHDVAWCRWVASFVTAPERLIGAIQRSLRIGGKVIFHEYHTYETWRMIPASHRVAEFVQKVMASWRDSGGEPNIAPSLIPLINAAGFKIVELRPLIFAVRPSDFMWQWPAAFVESNSQRLVDLGRVTSQWAGEVNNEFVSLSSNPDAVLVTPLVMEIIAERMS